MILVQSTAGFLFSDTRGINKMFNSTKEILWVLGACALTGDISRLMNDVICYAKTGTVNADPVVEEKLAKEYTKAGVYQSLWKLTKRETESDLIFKDLKERLEGKNPDFAINLLDFAGDDLGEIDRILGKKRVYLQ